MPPSAKRTGLLEWYLPSHAEIRWYLSYIRLFGRHPTDRMPKDLPQRLDGFRAHIIERERMRMRIPSIDRLRTWSGQYANAADSLAQKALEVRQEAADIEARTGWTRLLKSGLRRRKARRMERKARSLDRWALDHAQLADSMELEGAPVSESEEAEVFCVNLSTIGFDSSRWAARSGQGNARAAEIEWRSVTQTLERLALRRTQIAQSQSPSMTSLWRFWVPNPSLVRDEQGISELIRKAANRAHEEPIHIDGDYWAFKDHIYVIRSDQVGLYSHEELKLSVFEAFDRERRSFERIRNKMAGSAGGARSRPRIPEQIRVEIWRRDGGKCARCGSRENLEYDHIVPISQGGGNTVRNIELLCQQCNRSKGSDIT
jgi:hypothetical protein